MPVYTPVYTPTSTPGQLKPKAKPVRPSPTRPLDTSVVAVRHDMKNGKTFFFSTGNHPLVLVPMLHFRDAGTRLHRHGFRRQMPRPLAT